MHVAGRIFSSSRTWMLLAIAVTLNACDKGDDGSEAPDLSVAEDDADPTKEETGDEMESSDDPFAGKTFDDLTDLKVIPRSPLPAASAGTGGAVGGEDFAFTSSLEMVSNVYVYAPPDAAEKPYRLFGFLHGDGGGSSPNRDIAEKLSKEFGVIAFAATAPDKHSWWNGKGVSKTNHFDELIGEIKEKWNVDNSRLFLAGASGGSTFISAIYLPMFSYKQPTTAFVLCGGAENLLEEYLWTDVTQDQTKVHFYRAADDFLEDQIQTAISYYEGKGILASQVLDKEESGHCSFDIVDVVAKTM